MHSKSESSDSVDRLNRSLSPPPSFSSKLSLLSFRLEAAGARVWRGILAGLRALLPLPMVKGMVGGREDVEGALPSTCIVQGKEGKREFCTWNAALFSGRSYHH